MNYFTTGPTNHTQYLPPGEERTEIWDGDQLINFDTERNRLFAILLKEAFPRTRILVDERLKAVFARNLDWVVGNDPYQWNHHIHMHVNLGRKWW